MYIDFVIDASGGRDYIREISNELTRRLAEIRGGDETVTNHPNRKRVTSETHTFTFIANIGHIQKTRGTTKTRTWASGPTFNNRPASSCIATSDLNVLAKRVMGLDARDADARRAFIAAAIAMPDSVGDGWNEIDSTASNAVLAAAGLK